MPEIQAKILQISDLHLSRKTDSNVLDALCQIVAGERPHVLLLTGDLADQPVPWQMRRAARFVERLLAQLPDRPPTTLVIAGNHDYKLWGNIGLRRLSRIPFHVYFRRNGLALQWPRRWAQYLGLLANAVWPWGRQLRNELAYLHLADLGVAVFAFESNPLLERFTLATGAVESAQLRGLAARMAEVKKTPGWEFAWRIAVVHHHPLPVADLPLHLKYRVAESFMIFQNAGPFLRELSRHDFHLVLHGHKHFAGFLRVGHEIDGQSRRHLAVAAAGTAAHPHLEDGRGYHLNLVELLDDDTARLQSWFFSPSVLRKEESRVYTVHDLREVRARRYEIVQRQQGLVVGELAKQVTILPEGYSRIVHELRECRAVDPVGRQSWSLELEAPAPSYLRGVREASPPGSPAFLRLEPDPVACGLRVYRGKVEFGRRYAAGDPAFSFGWTYRLMNGHALTREEFARKYFGQDLDSEYASLMCDVACDRLTLVVELPEEFGEDGFRAEAEALYLPRPLRSIEDYDAARLRVHAQESARLRAQVDGSRIVLECVNPVPGFVYRLRWSFPAPAVAAPRPDLATETRVVAGQRRLRELIRAAAAGDAAAGARYGGIRDVMVALAQHLVATLPARPGESLDLALLVFNEDSQRLEFAGANFGEPEELLEESFVSGEGCAGFTFEKLRPLLFHSRRDDLGYYITPEERGRPPALRPHECLLTLPWFYPTEGPEEQRIPVGVLALGSSRVDSGLVRLFDLPPEQQDAEVEELRVLLSEIANGILELE